MSDRLPGDVSHTEARVVDANVPPASATPSASPPVFGTPAPGESGYAPDRPQFGDENDPNFKARRDALSRIALMSHLSDDQKSKLVTSVDRARAVGCIFIVPLNASRKALTAREGDVLVRGFQAPNIRKLMDDPTLVFVVLGYTKTEGNPQQDEKASLDCAQSVASTLRGRAGVQNVLYTTGMGEAKPIAQNVTPSSREVEIWAFYP